MQVVFGGPAADLSGNDKGKFAVRRLPQASGAERIVLQLRAASRKQFLFDLFSRDNSRHGLGCHGATGDVANLAVRIRPLEMPLHVFDAGHPSQFGNDESRIVPQKIGYDLIQIAVDGINVVTGHVESRNVIAAYAVAAIATFLEDQFNRNLLLRH